MMYETIDAALKQFQAGLNTCLPARIESYDHTKQSATVQPLINRRLLTSEGSESEQLPAIPSVPVVWPRSGGASLTFPVRRGDTCLLVFSQRSLDRWKSQGGRVTPDDGRKHALSDAIAIMGVQAFTGGDYPPDNTNVRLSYGEAQVRLGSDGRAAITGGGESLKSVLDDALGSVDSTLSALQAATIVIPSGSSAGVYPLANAAQFGIIATELAAIRARLGSLLDD